MPSKPAAKKRFFDDYTDIGGGGSFVAAAEKQTLIEQGIPFQITAVADDPHNEYGPRYVAFCLIPNAETGEEEERKIGFPVGSGVSRRDAMLAAMKEYLEGDDAEPVTVKLEKPGKAIILVPGDEA